MVLFNKKSNRKMKQHYSYTANEMGEEPKNEMLIGQIYKSNYSDIFYKIYGGSKKTVEVYNLDNIWDCINIKKEDIKKHFTLFK